MFIETLIFSIIVGLIRKGNIKNFGLIQLRGISFLFAAYLVQFMLNRVDSSLLDIPVLISANIGSLIHIGTYILLFCFFWLNRYQFNFLLPLGTFLNFVVITLNGGVMPVKTTYIPEESIVYLVESITHAIMTAETVLPFLGDIIYVSWPMQQMISVGDIVMNLGIFIFIQKTMVRRRRHHSCQSWI